MEYILVLLTAFVWGLSPIFDKIALKAVDTTLALAIRMTISGVILFVYLLFANKAKDIVNIPLKSFGAIIISAILSGVLGYIFYFKALSNYNVSKVVPMVSVYPLVASIIAVIFLGEAFSFTKFLGIILIVLGIIILNIK